MKIIGSQRRQKLAESGYTLHSRPRPRDVILCDGSGDFELWTCRRRGSDELRAIVSAMNGVEEAFNLYIARRVVTSLRLLGHQADIRLLNTAVSPSVWSILE